MSRRGLVVPVLVATAVALTGVLSTLLATHGRDPGAFMLVGRDDRRVAAYVSARLPGVHLTHGAGHDGRYFYVVAHDPLVLHPRDNVELADRPAYRAQRVLYPLLIAPFLAVSERTGAWAMLGINIVMLAIGTWLAAALALRLGVSPWWGAASFAINPGMLAELIIDGSGLIAWGLALAGLLALAGRRDRWAAVLMVGAVLARETILIVPVGAALYLWRRERRLAWPVVALPVAVSGAWWAYIHVRLAGHAGPASGLSVGAPFAGFWRVLSVWRDRHEWLNVVVAAMAIAVMVAVVVQAVHRPSLLTWGAGGFALLMPMLSGAVWLQFFDITRAVAPAFTAFIQMAAPPSGRARAPDGGTREALPAL